AEQRRGNDNGSDIFLLKVSRQQKLVVVIGAGDKEWCPQGDKKPAHNRHSAGTVFNWRRGRDCGRGRLRLPAPGARPAASAPKNPSRFQPSYIPPDPSNLALAALPDDAVLAFNIRVFSPDSDRATRSHRCRVPQERKKQVQQVFS